MAEDFLEALRNDKGYDYIADNYWQMSKEALKDICLEAMFILWERDQYLIEKLADELESRWDFLMK